MPFVSLHHPVKDTKWFRRELCLYKGTDSKKFFQSTVLWGQALELQSVALQFNNIISHFGTCTKHILGI